MAIDGISSVGAMNVSSTTKPIRQQETQIKVSEVTPSSVPVSVDTVAQVMTNNNNGNSQAEGNGSDRASVQSDKEISSEKIKAAVADLNNQVRMKRTQCSFKYHEETNRITITVTDSDTQEVIKEIPPEKALDMLAKAWELAGLMVDEKR